MELTDLMTRVYLGDGLYASFDGYQIELSASDGARKTNTVYLEPKVLRQFLEYVKTLERLIARMTPKPSRFRGVIANKDTGRRVKRGGANEATGQETTAAGRLEEVSR